MANLLSAVFGPEAIRIGFAAADFESAVRGLLEGELLERGVPETRIDSIIDAVRRREATGTTCSGPIALPHARIDDLPGIVAGLGINPKGIYPGEATQVMLAFVSPTDAAGDHLRFLSSAASVLRKADLRARIMDASTADEVLSLL
jgi:mannitol/fructose-specific phosphotransferase system IIA component (Ntr-type)